MKLYYFNPHTYATQWFVMANSKEEAIIYVQRWIDELPNDTWNSSFYQEELDRFKSGYRGAYERRGYTIEEHPAGSVIQSEIA